MLQMLAKITQIKTITKTKKARAMRGDAKQGAEAGGGLGWTGRRWPQAGLGPVGNDCENIPAHPG